MASISKIVIFILVNTLGFFSVGICYTLGRLSGVISISRPDFNIDTFQTWFLMGTMTTWFVCALFSFGYFLLPGHKARLLFLWAPVAVPFAYGLSILFIPVSS